MRRKILSFLLLCLTNTSYAQWRVGIIAGTDYNFYSRDNHYMYDWHYLGAWGKFGIGNRTMYISTLGVMGQYDVKEWFGIRIDLNWTMKNHVEYKTIIPADYEMRNGYIQLPIMTSFSFGSKKLRGFVNTGVYGGWWVSCHNYGYIIYKVPNDKTITFNNNNKEFDRERDQRFDYGLVGGAGIEWRFRLLKKNWAWQIFEARIYYSMRSTQKNYMRIKDPRYNTTVALQSGLCYYF